MSIRVVVVDIEGCLTVNKRQPIDIGQLTKIHAYCELARLGEKPPLVLCTGRPQPYAEAVIQMIDAFFTGYPSIVENGCFLYDPVDDILIPSPAVAGKEQKIFAIRVRLEEELVSRSLAKFEPGKELCLSLNPFPGSGQAISDLFRMVKEALPRKMKESVFITHSSSAVDLTPKGVSKASGLEFFSCRTGIAFAEMLGIGDTAGDFPMLERVGYPACPANASREVIDLVSRREGYVAKNSNAAGVWEIILQNL